MLAVKHKKSDLYFEIMDQISNPSKWAKEWTKNSKQKDGILFRNHRPANASDIPIQFYHQVFEKFINFARDCQISEEERELVLELASEMSGVFSEASERADDFRRWLELFFDDEIDIRPQESNKVHKSSGIGERMTGGSIYPKIGRDRVLLANLEVKPEPGTNGDSYIQNDAYYKEFVIKSREYGSEFYNRTCLPAFLINLEGPNLSICGAVCVPFIVCDRLTLIFPLDIIVYDRAIADYVSRTFIALKKSIHILKDYYKSVYESREMTCNASPWLPCINKIDLEEGTATIKYEERHSMNRNLWIVKIQTENTQEKGLVKFTQTYSKEAHSTCFELGLAPKLWAVNNLQKDWKIVVMGYLEEYKPLCTFPSEIILKTKDAVKNAAKLFHDSGYVHGDLRDENIMIKYENEEIDIKFVDFDWAGREGKAKYPESLNPTINWHPDVGRHKLIKKEHDLHLVDDIWLNIMPDDEPSKKRRRLSKWV
ncbi:Protein kinase-like domain containing protein [Gigaspora margarita]|uniref:Protein kinase-like domain containing protein n=1 Tax=Gigaspora margarita TaxID=4874 RepID=A0A8H4A0W7_GIGMA|nr:Protein kinase-like domain containing protein [Gigaspora margarita]